MIKLGVKYYDLYENENSFPTTIDQRDLDNVAQITHNIGHNNIQIHYDSYSKINGLDFNKYYTYKHKDDFQNTILKNENIRKESLSKMIESQEKAKHNNFYEECDLTKLFSSTETPSVYKLNGDQTTLLNKDITINDLLEPRNTDYIEDRNKQETIYKTFLSKDRAKKVLFGTIPEKEKSKIQEDIQIEENEAIPKPPVKWKILKDEDGDIYYYNVVTKACQWEKPEKLN